MRSREDIERDASYRAPGGHKKDPNHLILEVLLDVRDLLLVFLPDTKEPSPKPLIDLNWGDE